jgi:hypothetical protein
MNMLIISRLKRGVALAAAAVCILGLLSACGKSKPADAKKPESPAPAPAPAKTAAKPAERPDVDEDVAAMFATPKDPATMSEAEKAWYEVRQSLVPLSTIPRQLQTNENEPTKEEMARFEKQMGEAAGVAADKAKDFYTRFPNDEKAEMARRQELDLLQAAVELGETNRQARLDTLEDALMKNPKLTEDDRIELRLGQLQRRVVARHDEGEAVTLVEFEKGVRALQLEFTNRTEFSEMLLGVAEEWISRGETNKGQVIARDIIAGNGDKDVKDAAKELLESLDPKK